MKLLIAPMTGIVILACIAVLAADANQEHGKLAERVDVRVLIDGSTVTLSRTSEPSTQPHKALGKGGQLRDDQAREAVCYELTLKMAGQPEVVLLWSERDVALSAEIAKVLDGVSPPRVFDVHKVGNTVRVLLSSKGALKLIDLVIEGNRAAPKESTIVLSETHSTGIVVQQAAILPSRNCYLWVVLKNGMETLWEVDNSKATRVWSAKRPLQVPSKESNQSATSKPARKAKKRANRIK